MAQDGDGRPAGAVLVGSEFTAHERVDTQDGEIAGAHATLLDAGRRAVGDHVDAPAEATRRHRDVDGLRVVADGQERAAVHRVVLIFPARRSERRRHGAEPLRLRVRQRPEQQRVDDREDGGVDADADGEGDERDEGESGRLSQHADAVAEVAGQRLD
jgi:hypothetical protein